MPNTETQTPPSAPPQITPQQPSRRQSFRERFYTVWFYASILIILMQFAYSYRPRLDIQADVTANNQDPLSALFRIVNTGPLYLQNMRMICKFSTSSVKDFIAESNIVFENGHPATGSGPIAVLESGGIATRDCAAGSTSHATNIPPYDPLSLRLEVIVEFDWPFIPIPDKNARHFTVRRLGDGRVILVPDVEK